MNTIETDAENILDMRKIVKSFPGVKALDHVDFHVKRGEVHCLIGANGAGKSTLMKILSGAYTEDSGEIYFDGKKLGTQTTKMRRDEGIAIIYQELSLFHELTVGENVYLNNYPKSAGGRISWKKLYQMTQDLADSLNIHIDVRAKVADLNIGQRQLTEIMKALACNAKLIVMDEPSSTLSQAEFDILVKVIADLKAKGVTIIYISHHLEELFIVGDRVSVLKDGKFVICANTNELSEDKLVEYMTGVRTSQIHTEEKEIHQFSDEVVLELKDMSNFKVQNISLKLHKGEVLGLYGLVGAGRTEILQSIYGIAPILRGTMQLHGKEVVMHSIADAVNSGIGLAPESRKTQGLVLGLAVWENMSMVALKHFRRKRRLNYTEIDNHCNKFVDKLQIKTPSIRERIGNLSGGNQQKVILAKWLMQNCDILLLDEPTQGIDVIAKEEIYKLIRELTNMGKSVIIVSSELLELLRVCDNIHVMYDGRQVMIANKETYNQDAILHASVVGRSS